MTKKKQAELPNVDGRQSKSLSVVLREFADRLVKASQHAELVEAAAATGTGYAQQEQVERVQRLIDATRENMVSIETLLNAFAYQLGVQRDRAAAHRDACTLVAQAMREALAAHPDMTAEEMAAVCAKLEREEQP